MINSVYPDEMAGYGPSHLYLNSAARVSVLVCGDVKDIIA